MKRILVGVAALALLTSAQATEGVFDSNGVPIHYVSEGQGEAVVLIHGWMSDATMWGTDGKGNAKLKPTPGFRLIALDCRGHGKSGKPHDVAKYGPEMARDVIRLLDHLKISRAHLVGYSMGAFIAGKIAIDHPERTISVVYGGQAPILVDANATKSAEVEALANAVERGSDLGAYIIAVTPPDKPQPTMATANAMAQILFFGKDVKALAASGRSFGQLAVAPSAVRACKVPSLFVYGSNEGGSVKSAVEAALKLLPNAKAQVIPGTDHMSTLRSPEFGKAILEFILANKTHGG